MISLQNLDHEDAFSEGDVRLLSTLAASLGVALENVRLFDETKRLLAESTARAAELAIVNEIGTALVKPREMQAVLEAVGDRAAQALGARGLSICLVNPRTNELTFDYWVDEGVRVRDREGVVLGDPLSAEIVRSGRPFRVGTAEEAAARGFPFAVGNTESYLGVPIPAGDRAIGVFAVGTRERDAYSEADERVMSTLAASMGVALENARLFDETKRLLAETEQRNAELAVVNEIGAALGKQLDFEAIIDAVGDRVGQILGSGEISIAILDEKTGLISFPYWVENGVRERNLEPLPLGRGLTSHVIQTGQPLRLGTADEADQYDVHWVGVRTESYLAAPIRTGDRVFGVLSVSDERANAFGEADERLLSTLASSMGVAIENARLFDETKRLLAESNERAAELAIINSVQQGLASQLDMQAMYDLVGDKIREIFDAQVVDIGLYDLDAGIIRFAYGVEKGVRQLNVVSKFGPMAALVAVTGRPLLINDVDAWIAEHDAEVVVPAGEPSKSVLLAPLVVGSEVRGHISLQNIDRTNAFTESDERLLTTLASSLSVALENARLVDETRQRASELAIVNDVGQAAAAQLDLDRLIELTGEQLRTTFRADIVYVALLDAVTGVINFPYRVERGKPAPREPLRLGEGLTSRILPSREPLLLNRAEHFEVMERQGIGTAVKSYLGVPILVADKAIGVVSVQSIDEEGRFGEFGRADPIDYRLERRHRHPERASVPRDPRRARETAELDEVGREISATLDQEGFSSASPSEPSSCSRRRPAGSSCPSPTVGRSGPSRPSARLADVISDNRSSSAKGSSVRSPRRAAPSSSTTHV